jgi:hypothetical protein
MKKNTINLSIKQYNKLRDFKNAIQNNKSVSFYYNWDGGVETIFYTKDEAVKEVSEANKKLKLKINELINSKKNQITFEELKKMSLWQFINWKRKNG